MLQPRFHCITRHCIIITALALCGSAAAVAQPTLATAYDTFTDVNNNGALDCGEPVHVRAAFFTHESNPASPITGSLTVPAAGSTGLIYLPGSLKVDHDPIPTVGCDGVVVPATS